MDKLLLAEPDDLLRNGLLEFLRRTYDVTVCKNGRTVLELLDTMRPKVAIIDLSLTELDGPKGWNRYYTGIWTSTVKAKNLSDASTAAKYLTLTFVGSDWTHK